MAGWHRSIDGAVGWLGPALLVLGALLGVANSLGTTAASPAGDGADTTLGLFAVGVRAVPPVIEPGLAVDFAAQPAGGQPPFQYNWSDSYDRFGVGDNFTEWARAPGLLSATVTVVDATGAVAAATFVEPISSGLDLRILAANSTDSGFPFTLWVNLSGGVPPYRANVTVVGGPSVEENLSGPGAYPIPLWSLDVGAVNASVSVTDSIGAVSSRIAPAVALNARPSLEILAAPIAAEAGVPYTWWTSIEGGTSPFSIVGSCAVLDASLTGPPPTPGTDPVAAWHLRFNGSGTALVRFDVRDAAGALDSRVQSLDVAPPISAFLSFPDENGTRSLELTVEGGVGPYEFRLTASDTERRIANSTGAGTFGWTLANDTGAPTNVSVEVSDSAGGVLVVNATVPGSPPEPVAPAPPDSPSGWDPAWVLGAVAPALVAGVLVDRFVLRRADRSTAVPSAVAPAIDPVRRLLGESDALDRESLYVYGEDENLSRAAIDAGVAEWTRRGRIESIRGAGGEELLRWIEDPEPAASEGA